MLTKNYIPTMQMYQIGEITILNFGKCTIDVKNDYKDFVLQSIMQRATYIFDAKGYKTQSQYDAVVYYVVTRELAAKNVAKYGICSIDFIDITKQ